MNATTCKSCGNQIVWFKTGKINPKTGTDAKMPVDAHTVEHGDDELDLSRHQSHFVTCPHANTWRKPR